MSAVPWILQEFVAGHEYCAQSTVRDGKVQLHGCCVSSPFQLNYQIVDKPEIEAWVRRFVGALGVTGQVSFDFIETDDRRVYAIECNPRTHSAIHYSLFDFRLDPDDDPWLLEAGLYCSFADKSVISVMSRAASISRPDLFGTAVGQTTTCHGRRAAAAGRS